MKIVTWNINGIRTFKGGIKKALDLLDADIVCFQETKVTRDLLDERTAIVDGYNSYFSFSRGRSGYSGVATFCKDSATPVAAEEGLTGLLTNHGGAVGCYGDQGELSTEELQLLDNEGRAVITQHRVMCKNQEKTLTVLNVYCPRADPEKPERRLFKLQFYKLLQARAEAILGAGSHVIVLGDVNTSHRPIDHCDPDDIENFEDNPGRKWLDSFLFGRNEEGEEDEEGDEEPVGDGKFIDTFRYFHPTRTNAFTCWSTLTGARQTNYGTRIDYIFADRVLTEMQFLAADIMPEVEGSDHCPVQAHLRCALLPNPKCPPLCTRHMPEFAGRQQKLSQFLVRVDQQALGDSRGSLPGSQESGEIRENLNPLETGNGTGKKRGPAAEASAPKGKKSKTTKNAAKPQGNLLAFFKPKLSQAAHLCEAPQNHLGNGQDCNVVGPSQGLVVENPSRQEPAEGVDSEKIKELQGRQEDSSSSNDVRSVAAKEEQCGNGRATPTEDDEAATCPKKEGSLGFWKSVLRGPPQPPNCKVHDEPCVLRTVKKAGPNMGRQFFVCARPQGHASNPQARCNFFAWVDKGK
ncbi:hypothetical protein MATL_G00070430 [Megalops atlanticus]|uniref:DNA-(apurinic or apyrimidinic site) endonuclease n=1 Tax=Megalops atlanticus TaxID=7932 RepID=A0A9D3Q5F4_MEGAT|nr:hypothetical protein MATL_G00070430 [Megalops atlanticus]